MELKHNDQGNAQRLLRRYGKRVRYVRGVGWLVRATDTASYWRFDEGADEVKKLFKQVFNEELEGAWHDFSTSERGLKQALQSLRSEPGVIIQPEQLDRSPFVLATPDGVLELDTLRLRDPGEGEYLTQVTRASWNEKAPAPTYDEMILEAMGGDPEMVAYFHRTLGYAATGLVKEKAIYVIIGPRDSGKTTLFTVLAEVLGDYGKTFDPEALFVRSENVNAFPSACVQLYKARLVFGVEPDKELRYSSARWNKVGGMDYLEYKLMHKDKVPFRPTHTAFILANRLPNIDGEEAVLTRLDPIDFGVTHYRPDEEAPEGAPVVDRKLYEKLIGEADGILARVGRGSKDYLANGIRTPAKLAAERQELKDELNTVAAFIRTHIRPEPGTKTLIGDIKDSYRRFCVARGEQPESDKYLAKVSGIKRFPRKKSHGKWYRMGLALVPESEALDISEEGVTGVSFPRTSSCVETEIYYPHGDSHAVSGESANPHQEPIRVDDSDLATGIHPDQSPVGDPAGPLDRRTESILEGENSSAPEWGDPDVSAR